MQSDALGPREANRTQQRQKDCLRFLYFYVILYNLCMEDGTMLDEEL